ncbi:MAG: preprotein translocase subunit SecG [Parcubacteria group bacterium]
MDKAFAIAQVATGLLMALLILLQPKGVGLGQVFGGEGNVYRTKRGAEKIVYNATIVLAIVFAGLALARILL